MGTTTSELTHAPETEETQDVGCSNCDAHATGANKFSSHFFPDDESKKIKVVYTKVKGGGDNVDRADGTGTVLTKEGDHLVKILAKANQANLCVKCFVAKEKTSFDLIKSMCLKKGYFVNGNGQIYDA